TGWAVEPVVDLPVVDVGGAVVARSRLDEAGAHRTAVTLAGDRVSLSQFGRHQFASRSLAARVRASSGAAWIASWCFVPTGQVPVVRCSVRQPGQVRAG